MSTDMDINIALFDLELIGVRINELSGLGDSNISNDSLLSVLRAVIDNVLAYTNRRWLNEQLVRCCVDLVALSWLKLWFLADDTETALVLGDVLSISEGDTRIAYQNRAQINGIGASWGSYDFLIENINVVLKRYRRLHWGTAQDDDYDKPPI